jgi:hypothetical protein
MLAALIDQKCTQVIQSLQLIIPTNKGCQLIPKIRRSRISGFWDGEEIIEYRIS